MDILLKILGCFMGLLVTVIVLGSVNYRRVKARQRRDFETVFGSQGESLPKLQFGTGMGWPTFTVIFKDKEALAAAAFAGITDAFKQQISSYYGPDFDVNLAVGFVYEGQYSNWPKTEVSTHES